MGSRNREEYRGYPLIVEVIGESTPVTIGFVVAMVGGFVGGIWKTVSAFKDLGSRIDNTHEKTNHRLDLLEQSLGARMSALENRPHGYVPKSVMRAWISAMRAANEGKGITWVKLSDVDEEEDHY